MKTNKQCKILLTGGGTGGSVTPLLAIVESLKANSNLEKFDFLWLGTKNGVEKSMVEKEEISFKAITSGKFRRYFSFKNLIDPFFIIAGFLQSLIILIKWRPQLILCAGGFVGVPVVWAGWLLRVPIIIHQQDIRPGLANKLMSPFAKIVTVVFERSLDDFGGKAKLIGNPIRRQLTINNLQLTEIQNNFNLKSNLPTVLIVGGGTGSEAINNFVYTSLNKLSEQCQIIHQTGPNKFQKSKIQNPNYIAFEFLNSEQISDVLRVADLVVSRCGIGFLSELVYLGKPAILIPMPDSHQEDNAQLFKNANAAIVLEQKKIKS